MNFRVIYYNEAGQESGRVAVDSNSKDFVEANAAQIMSDAGIQGVSYRIESAEAERVATTKANQCPACRRYNDRESCPYCGHTTDEQLVKLRQKAVSENAEYLGANPVFTCDNCRQRNKCEFVFDNYNTNGDCIAEK